MENGDMSGQEMDLYSSEDVKEAVIAYLNKEYLEESGGTYTIVDDETTESDTEYQFMIRYAMSDEEAQEIIDRGGIPSANVLAGMAMVNKETGEAEFEGMSGDGVHWNLKDEK